MKIKQVVSQCRRDMVVIYECEHCGSITGDEYAYDDHNFHHNVIPQLKCAKCSLTSPTTYRPLATRHPEGEQV